MIETCAKFSLLTPSAPVSGGDLSFSARRVCSERQIKRAQFMMEFDSIITLRLYYSSSFFAF